MTYDIPLTPRPFHERNRLDRSALPGSDGLSGDGSSGTRRVVTAATLAAHGVPEETARARCRAGGPWRMLLPGVFLLHPGPPTSEDRLRAVLLYTLRPDAVPRQTTVRTPAGVREPEAMITGAAALAMHGLASAPPLPALNVIDVSVPRTRRLRSTGFVRVLADARILPAAEEVAGMPVAPVARALADAVACLDDASTVQRLLTEAVRDGHCEAQSVLRELEDARLLTAPQVVDALDGLIAEGRSVAEGRLYDMVRTQGVPAPCWNVDLRLPGGPHLGGVDAYWPDEAVALTIDARTRRQVPAEEDADGFWDAYAEQRERLEQLGITVVHVTPRKLREAPEQQAAVVRTALMAARDREPAAYVLVLPR